MNTKKLQNIKNSFKIAFIYFAAGVLWIMLSDLLLSFFVDDSHKITLFQTYKGWFYILATTVILFFLTQHYFKMMHQQYLQIISEIQKHEQYLLESKEKFYKLSHIDQLTNLPNRLFISEAIKQKIEENKPFVLILFDLDEFKMMNDSYGHRFGDKILLEITHILQDVFGTDTFIARMGGDEFGVIYEEKEINAVQKVMDRLYARFNNPFELDFIHVYATASAGICRFPEDAVTMEEMYQEADVAMYNAKKIGKNIFSFYDKQFTKETLFQTQIITRLKQALDTNQLELYFQSQNDANTNEIVGLEALLRWKSEGEMIPPDVFIPLAEQTTLIIDIGNFVLQRGFETIVRWRKLQLLRQRMAINISARHLMHIDFIQTLKSLLAQTQCLASWVELEITESCVLENPALTIRILEQLKELGFHISMDDFGAGYSSLSYLKNLPIDKLKIDKSFITDIAKEPKNQIIVKTIIFLAKELKFHILAEGVETQEELDFLINNKIDSIQGYYYTKPLPEMQMQELLHPISL
ncbi:MAG: EAL domain-containing protein [Sulfurimonas sp.]|nr:EAL domain-containing protein [Sulfurimonas sp.]